MYIWENNLKAIKGNLTGSQKMPSKTLIFFLWGQLSRITVLLRSLLTIESASRENKSTNILILATSKNVIRPSKKTKTPILQPLLFLCLQKKNPLTGWTLIAEIILGNIKKTWKSVFHGLAQLRYKGYVEYAGITMITIGQYLDI